MRRGQKEDIMLCNSLVGAASGPEGSGVPSFIFIVVQMCNKNVKFFLKTILWLSQDLCSSVLKIVNMCSITVDFSKFIHNSSL